MGLARFVPLLFFLSKCHIETVHAAQSCPPECTCISNSLNRPDIETTVVDCSYQKFSAFPSTLPNSTTELFMQGSYIDSLDSVINSTAFTREGTAYTTPLTMLEVLRLDKNPIKNISFDLLSHENFANLKWLYLPRGLQVLEQKPLKLVDHGIPDGWVALPSHPLENRDYVVWTRSDYTPILDSGKNPTP